MLPFGIFLLLCIFAPPLAFLYALVVLVFIFLVAVMD